MRACGLVQAKEGEEVQKIKSTNSVRKDTYDQERRRFEVCCVASVCAHASLSVLAGVGGEDLVHTFTHAYVCVASLSLFVSLSLSRSLLLSLLLSLSCKRARADTRKSGSQVFSKNMVSHSGGQSVEFNLLSLIC